MLKRLESLCLSDDALRELYKAARQGGYAGLATLAEAAGLGEDACAAGLMALAELQLLTVRWQPFDVRMLPTRKCDPNDSALVRALRGTFT